MPVNDAKLLVKEGYLKDNGDNYTCTKKGAQLLIKVSKHKPETPTEQAMLRFALKHRLIEVIH